MANKKKKQTDWDALEQEARKRSAWGSYVQTMYNIRAEEVSRKGKSGKEWEDEMGKHGHNPGKLYIG